MMGQEPLVVGLGEVLWDVFPDGPRFGGAPANFACHAAALGAAAHVVSGVGTDALGDRAVAALESLGVDTGAVGRSAEYPTGTVEVVLDGTGQPRYEITTNVAWDHLEWSGALAALAARAEAVCFGTLAQRSAASRQTIRQFVAATPPAALRILDVNLRPPFVDSGVIRESLGLANVLKLNNEELPVVAAACGIAGPEDTLAGRLRERFNLAVVALTRGPRGAVLYSRTETSDSPGVPTEVVDTVGAGDAFTAAMAMGLLGGLDLATINRQACLRAAQVCAQPGAAPRP